MKRECANNFKLAYAYELVLWMLLLESVKECVNL